MNREQLKLFEKIPVLTTPRLTLRKITPSDLADVYEYSSDPQVSRFLLWKPHEDKTYTKHYLNYLHSQYKKGRFYDWGIELKENGRMIGTCGFSAFDVPNNSAEIGYVLNQSYWGQSIAKEAAMKVIEFGFLTLDLQRISAKYIIENVNSLRVMKKCNMTFEGIHKRAVKCKGLYRDVGVCAITRDEFLKLKSTQI